MTSSNGREPIDQRLDRLVDSVQGLTTQVSELGSQVSELRGQVQAVVEQFNRVGPALLSISNRVGAQEERLDQLRDEFRADLREQNAQIQALLELSRSHEHRLQNLERG